MGLIIRHAGFPYTDPDTLPAKDLETDIARAYAEIAGNMNNDNVRATADINGSFTLWVRRPLVGIADYAGNDRVILTAEGTSPTGGAAGIGRPVSVRRLEMVLRLPSSAGVEGTGYSDTTTGSDSTAPTSLAAAFTP